MDRKNLDNLVLELEQISTTLSNVAEALNENKRIDAPDIIYGCCNHIDRIVEDLNDYEQ